MFFLLQFQLLIWIAIASTSTLIFVSMSYVVDLIIIFQFLTFLPGFSAAGRGSGRAVGPALANDVRRRPAGPP
jgi:hypothetical protein